jgi:hypothetical protein
MATLTATNFSRDPKVVENGVVSVYATFNAGATALDASAVTIQMLKIPHGARVTEIVEYHTTGATSCPVDIGISGALSQFSSQATQGAVSRIAKEAGIGYQVSVSDDAALRYAILTVTPTLASSTTSFKTTIMCSYSMDA